MGTSMLFTNRRPYLTLAAVVVADVVLALGLGATMSLWQIAQGAGFIAACVLLIALARLDVSRSSSEQDARG